MSSPADYWSGTTRYRKGARDAEARAAHAVASAEYRQALAEAAFPPAAQRELLADVEAGTSVRLAAQRIGLTSQFVYAYAQRFPAFGARLDTALWVAAPDDCPHGTGNGYRHYGCCCSQCRAAHRLEARPPR